MLFEHTTLAATASALVEALESYGCDAEALFKRARVDIDAIRRPGARYTYGSIMRLWQEVRAETNDPAVGLLVGQHMRPSALYSLGLSWISSPTMLEGIHRVERYSMVTSTLMHVHITEDREQVKLAVSEADSNHTFAPEGVDTALSLVVCMCRSMSRRHFAPLLVKLSKSDNGRIDRYIEFFQAPIRFDSDEDALIMDAAEMRQPLLAGNQEIAYENDKITERYLASLNPDLLQDKVRELLVTLLPSGNVNQQVIADNLNRSVSALQRQLKAEGVSFRQILDQTRSALATQLVREQQYSLAEIAYLLGFNDQANFCRAFKRWIGDTPSSYRTKRTADAVVDEARN